MQNNKTIKSESGSKNMVNMEDKEYLRKLEICFLEIHAFLENNDPERNLISKSNKEQSPSFCTKYVRDVNKVCQ